MFCRDIAQFSRKKAVSLHTLFSLLIFGILISLMYFDWYPDFMFDTDGGWQGLQLISGVDFILGPFLTLLIFKPGKVGLKKDLAVIGLIQISSLFAGVWIVYHERPLAVIFTDFEYRAISRGSLEFVEQKPDILDRIPGDIPKWIYLDLPESREERDVLRRKQFSDGPLALTFSRWLPYADHAQKVRTYGWTVAQIVEKEKKNNPKTDVAEKIEQWLKKNQRSEEEILIFDYMGRYRESYLMVEAKTGQVFGLIPGKIGRFYSKPPKTVPADHTITT